ncbi:alcohol dehydrogenase [Chrysochromulina tobinii]|uniref:Alcohol dehydrogenase n=1 Tax=Chrysochromulina tobinii TaxID=1460289 RepID=A0A0M0J6T1_9EUKA|nr:alcohol dehydrogenase [Chrysochromulina tobinii]|eukprot:KOO22311.1 alcohol dehydrogenase [Chrysochromulina sp. CCMP291]
MAESTIPVSPLADASKGAVNVLCMATADAKCNFQPVRFQRRAVGPNDVLLDMKYCGVCHTDLHSAQGQLAALTGKCYPCVPGHELAGVAVAVGDAVTRVKVGDHVGHTLGGYSDKMVVHERFAVIIPKTYPLECAGPVMCAGVTLFDPLRRYGAGKGTRVAIVGVGGLGQMGIRIAKALGCVVTAITRTAGKADFARECGADEVIVSTDAEQMLRARRARALDLVLNTIPSEHDYSPYTALLSGGGRQIMLGLNTGLIAGMVVNGLCCGRSRVAGSGIGGIEATQAVIDLCDKHGIKPFIKVVPVENLNRVYEELEKCNESGARFVLDIAGSLNEDAFKRCAEAAPPNLGPPAPPLTLSAIIGGICGLLCLCRWC